MANKLSKPTILLHWLSGIMFLSIFILGLYFSDMPSGSEKFKLMGIHKSLGALFLVLAVIRIAWRIKEGPLPAIAALPRWQEILSSSVHHLLLLITVVMPISGIMMNIGGGRATAIFGFEILSAGEKIEWVGSVGHTIHEGAVAVIFLLLLMHIGAALKHQFIDKDGILSRMLGGTPK